MKKIIYSLIMLLAMMSCSEDILELSPLDKLSENDVWNNEDLIELYVNSSYNAVGHGFQFAFWSSFSGETHLVHDAGSWMVMKGEITPDNVGQPYDLAPPFNYWGSAYSSIRKINVFFQEIQEAPVEAAKKDLMIGEMKFIRAFIYAHLIWRYGGVPVIEDVFELGEDFQVSRDSYDDCVDFIAGELDEAISLLPPTQPDSEKGRASANAAKALKARVLLYAASALNNPGNDRGKWEKAANASEALLNAGYSLYDDYQNLFLQETNEIIYARYFTKSNSAREINLFNGRNGSEGQGGNCPSQNLVNAYEMTNGELPYIEENGQLVVNPASGFDPENPYVNRDPRFYETVLYDGAVWMGRETETFDGGKDSPASSTQPWNASRTGYYLKKFLPPDLPPVGSADMPTAPFIFFRYGEVLLNYAEAMFELGEEDIAREYLNKIRSRSSVQMPPVTASGEELREKIYHERRIEMAIEGHRFFDVRRWKIAMETENKPLLRMQIIKNADGSKSYEMKPVSLDLVRNFETKHYLLPIPRVEIDRSLGALEQNPGYDN